MALSLETFCVSSPDPRAGIFGDPNWIYLIPKPVCRVSLESHQWESRTFPGRQTRDSFLLSQYWRGCIWNWAQFTACTEAVMRPRSLMTLLIVRKFSNLEFALFSPLWESLCDTEFIWYPRKIVNWLGTDEDFSRFKIQPRDSKTEHTFPQA